MQRLHFFAGIGSLFSARAVSAVMLSVVGLMLTFNAQAQISWGMGCRYALPEFQNATQRSEYVMWTTFRELAYRYMEALPAEPDPTIVMPVQGVRVRQVADTFGAPRPGGRIHEGQDVFAPRGTSMYSATYGYVLGTATTVIGGNIVYILGAGGRRYYYAHLDRIAEGLEPGTYVTPNTLIGTVGNTGNAITTPPHLHFGIYYGTEQTCNGRVIDPLPLMVDR